MYRPGHHSARSAAQSVLRKQLEIEDSQMGINKWGDGPFKIYDFSPGRKTVSQGEFLDEAQRVGQELPGSVRKLAQNIMHKNRVLFF